MHFVEQHLKVKLHKKNQGVQKIDIWNSPLFLLNVLDKH